MYREDQSGFNKIPVEIQKKLRGIEEITPFVTNDKRIVLRFLEEGFSEPFYSSRMSDGTLKLFAYYLQLESISKTNNISIDHAYCIAVEELEAWLLGDMNAIPAELFAHRIH